MPVAAGSEGAENGRLRRQLQGYPRLRRLVEALRPPLPYDLHGRMLGQRAFEAALPSQRRGPVLDLGSGRPGNGQWPGISPGLATTIIATDLYPGPGVAFAADAHNIPIANDTLDGVILQGVVEHVARPWIVAKEVVRVLRPGGVVFCEAPFVQWFHEDPSDYFRFTENGLREMFENCDVVESGVAVGPVGAAIGIGRELLPILFTSPYLYWPLKWVLAWLTSPLILFDRLYRNRPRARTIALGVYLVARKRGARV